MSIISIHCSLLPIYDRKSISFSYLKKLLSSDYIYIYIKFYKDIYKYTFSLEQKCLTAKNIVYKAKVTSRIEIIKKKFISARAKPPLKNDFQITSHLI